jgi:hypothetical protein
MAASFLPQKLTLVAGLYYRPTMRLRLGALCLALTLFGCAHKKPPPPPPPPPPPAPKGDLLRFQAKVGDSPKGSAKLTIEEEQGGKKHAFSVSFSEEQKVDAIDDKGTASVTARLVDAVGSVDAAGRKPAEVKKEQEAVDDFALALDDLKIQWKRAPTGEIGALTFTGLHKPLDEGTARAVFNAMYGAGRGSVFPEKNVEVGGTWNGAAPLPTGLGVTGAWAYTYSYRNKSESGVAFITCDGVVNAQGATVKLTGSSKNSLRFNVGEGRLLSNIFESNTEAQQGTAPAASKRIHLEWTAEEPAGSAAPAAPNQ